MDALMACPESPAATKSERYFACQSKRKSPDSRSEYLRASQSSERLRSLDDLMSRKEPTRQHNRVSLISFSAISGMTRRTPAFSSSSADTGICCLSKPEDSVVRGKEGRPPEGASQPRPWMAAEREDEVQADQQRRQADIPILRMPSLLGCNRIGQNGRDTCRPARQTGKV